MDELPGRAAREGVHSLTSRSTFYPLVAPIDFGPGLLKNEHPDLIDVIRALRGLREGPPIVLLIVREVIVDNHRASLPIYIHLNSVTASIVDLLGQKDPLDSIRELREGRQRR